MFSSFSSKHTACLCSKGLKIRCRDSRKRKIKEHVSSLMMQLWGTGSSVHCLGITQNSVHWYLRAPELQLSSLFLKDIICRSCRTVPAQVPTINSKGQRQRKVWVIYTRYFNSLVWKTLIRLQESQDYFKTLNNAKYYTITSNFFYFWNTISLACAGWKKE